MGPTTSCGPKTCVASSKGIIYGVKSRVKSKLLFILRMKMIRSLLIVLKIRIARITKSSLGSATLLTAGLSHECQLWGLVNMKQAPKQLVNEFLSGMKSIWDQLEQSAHIVKDPANATILATKRDQFCLIEFLMALTSKFESVCAALLQHVPFFTLEFAIRDIFCLNALPSNVDIVIRLITLSTTSVPRLPSQDPQTNQVLGTGRRVGQMFELTSLHLPFTPTPSLSYVAHTTSVFPLSLWHLRLVPSTILPIPPADSPVFPLASPLAVDPVLDQASLLPPTSLPDLSPVTPPADSPYKARLIAKKYAQEYEIDYEETFASVAHIIFIRSLLAIAAVHQWALFQMDVKNAFFKCKLLKPWFAKFSSIVHQFGFSSNPHDTTLFIRRSDKGMIVLLLYVDDMIITGDGHSGIFDFNLLESLVYLTVTRPDIAHAIHLVSQFLAAPHSTQYAAVIHILRYIKGTMFHGLHFFAHSILNLYAYFDADWAEDPIDRCSTTGFCFFFRDSLISWCSKKQYIVSCSSIDAEYHALADITSELLRSSLVVGRYGSYTFFANCHTL
uniref:Reverse transcriptase Ty1/copia-type domain-containing protein n=1 Tax=Fagus sylvatica TaxID=28930 RepID=A0A2N9FKY6_FAGSY